MGPCFSAASTGCCARRPPEFLAAPNSIRLISPMTEEPQIELKRPGFAALLAWLWPGAGHLYQGRTAKGVLYMVCILGTYFYGLVIGQGHVVYASWTPEDRRLPYLCQVGVGLPALPALLQTRRVRNGQEPLFGGMMAPEAPLMVSP